MAPKISVTFLSSYMYCPRKLYLEQVLKIIKIPKKAVVKGTVRHSAYECINKAEEALVCGIKKEDHHEEIFSRYKEAYTKILQDAVLKNRQAIEEAGMDMSILLAETLPLIIGEAKARSTNAFSFSKKTGLFENELWSALTPKIESEIRMESESLGIKGIIDELRRHKEETVPVELKTGKTPEFGVWPGHKVQIGAYIMLLKEKNFLVKEGVVRYLDSGAERQVILDPFLEKEIKELIEKVKTLLSQKSMPLPCLHKNKCVACNLYEECAEKIK